jgi:DNA-binding LytR/AlgR family response regulator
MTTNRPLRVFYLEDNPLIVFHVEAMIEDLGHIFAGSLASFSDLKSSIDQIEMDAALIDIDLADGATGPAAAEWLHKRGIVSLFVTGQEHIAAEHTAVSLGTISKPIELNDFAAKLELLQLVARSKS